jgi:hypothetical protein
MFNNTVIANDIFNIASKNNGRVFGGYLRDVLIPCEVDPSLKVSFNDIDIWFMTELEAIMFINDINDINDSFNLREIVQMEIKPKTIHYTFGRQQYHLYQNNKCVLWIDVIISDIIPVDDFDVNYLTCIIEDDIKIFKSFSENYTTEDLISKIKSRRVSILDSYVLKLINDNASFHHIFNKRINRNYSSKSYTITFKDYKFPKHINCDIILNSFRAFRGWIELDSKTASSNFSLLESSIDSTNPFNN